MRKGLFRRKVDTLLGIDISDAAIRLVELRLDPAGYSVAGYAIHGLPARAVVDGAFLDFEGIGQALRAALPRVQATSRRAAVAVSGPSVITRLIELEAGLAEEEMAGVVEREAEQYIPYPLDDMAFDFQVQGRSVADPTRVEVLLAACLKEHVEAREAVLAMAGLVPAVVDVEAFAMARASSQDFASFTSGHRVDGAQWAMDAQGMGIACGLALRSFA